jgi:hypothetical protein
MSEEHSSSDGRINVGLGLIKNLLSDKHCNLRAPQRPGGTALAEKVAKNRGGKIGGLKV